VDAQTWGVWLIGSGALIIVLGLVFGSERPTTGITFQGPFNTRFDRLRFAVQCAGAALVAAGSVVLAIAEPPSLWLFVILPAVYVIVHVLVAWKLRQYWRFRLDQAERAVRGDAATDLEHRMARCARTCASWRWSLRHPFNDEDWPRAEMRNDER
jgi:hypothetical protein